MGSFNNTKIFSTSPSLIDKASADLTDQLRAEGYEIDSQKLISGGYDISIVKGNMVKAVLAMRTALKIKIIPFNDKILVEASIGIFGQQVVPTLITMFLFWPVIIPQIWGLVQQSKLDDHVLEIIEASLKRNEEIKYQDLQNNKGVFCTNCGKTIVSDSKFCSFCGSSV